MKALLLEEYKKLAIVEYPEPEIGPDDILVRVASCGICGSDVHGFDGGSGRRIPPSSWVTKLLAQSLRLVRT